MNIKKTILLSVSILLLTGTISLADDFEIPEGSIEVINAKEVKSSYDKDKSKTSGIDAIANSTLGIEEETTDNFNIKEVEGLAQETEAEPIDPLLMNSSMDMEDINAIEDKEEKVINKFEKEKDKKFKVVKYSKVKYDKNYLWYSILDHRKKAFKDLVNKYKIPNAVLKNLHGKINSTKAILLNAFLYDYVYHKPEIAENFYNLFNKTTKSRASMKETKLRKADYYIRTGRPELIKTVLNKTTCSSNIKFMATCNYYLGVADYLMTGNNRNGRLRQAKNYISKAKKIYYNKK